MPSSGLSTGFLDPQKSRLNFKVNQGLKNPFLNLLSFNVIFHHFVNLSLPTIMLSKNIFLKLLQTNNSHDHFYTVNLLKMLQYFFLILQTNARDFAVQIDGGMTDAEIVASDHDLILVREIIPKYFFFRTRNDF